MHIRIALFLFFLVCLFVCFSNDLNMQLGLSLLGAKLNLQVGNTCLQSGLWTSKVSITPPVSWLAGLEFSTGPKSLWTCYPKDDTEERKIQSAATFNGVWKYFNNLFKPNFILWMDLSTVPQIYFCIFWNILVSEEENQH